jgi:excisionase family DNA binding protein
VTVRPSDADAMLDVTAAAAVLGTGTRYVRRLIAERRIPFYRVGRHVRIARADLDAFLAAGRVEASA